MTIKRLAVAFAGAAILSGCVTTEVARFQPGANQQSIIRDGRHAIVSKKKGSIVLVSPATRDFRAGNRPVFVVGITNLTKQPTDLLVQNISVVQKQNGQAVASLPVVTYDQLASEERSRQVAAAILVGLAAGANAAAAANAGHGTAYGTVRSTTYTPYGTVSRVSNVSASYYDPTAAAIAQANASAQNAAMIDNAVETGRRNLAALEQTVIKDNTLLPGEWYGGQLHFEAPKSEGSEQPKNYVITISVGSDLHEIEVVQGAAQSS
jgi:hypothetical protein